MSSLPDRPDLDQLRRQARELQRAAAGGDPGALRRVQQVSAKTTLSAAQLAVAREYGFASWARLKDEAERRRLSAPVTAQAAPVPTEPWRGVLAADGDDDADELIERQYADRPQLRPVLRPAGNVGGGVTVRVPLARPASVTPGHRGARESRRGGSGLRGGSGTPQGPGSDR
jgi:hypothetical protein